MQKVKSVMYKFKVQVSEIFVRLKVTRALITWIKTFNLDLLKKLLAVEEGGRVLFIFMMQCEKQIDGIGGLQVRMEGKDNACFNEE